MFKIFYCNNSLIVFDKSDKEFRTKYGNKFEQVSVIKDIENIDSVTKKLQKQYNCSEVVHDYKVKKKFHWKYFTPERIVEVKKKLSESLKQYVKTEEHKKNLSIGSKNKRNFLGKKHSEETKKRYAEKRKTWDPINGRKWMHNPYTGEEKRGFELLPGMLWGRSPELGEFYKSSPVHKKPKS